MIRLLLTLPALLLAVRAQCDWPEVAPLPLPTGYQLQTGPEYNDGPVRTMICPENFVAKADLTADPFTLGGVFTCNKTTLKFTNPDGYEASKLMSCVTGSPPFCPIYHKQENGAIGHVAIYPGKELICGAGKKLQLADGTVTNKVICRPDAFVDITTASGTTAHDTPTLKCFPSVVCPPVLLDDYPAPYVQEDKMVSYIEEDGIAHFSCPYFSFFILQLAAGAKSFTKSIRTEYFTCNATTGRWTREDMDVHALSCGKYDSSESSTPSCTTDLVSKYGYYNIELYPGHEQICPAGQVLQYGSDGSTLKDVICLTNRTMQYDFGNGTVSKYGDLRCGVPIDPNLINDIIEITAGANITFSYYFYKVTEEFKPSVEVNGVITYYAKIEMTQCRRDVPADKDKIKNSPIDCPLKADAKTMYLVIKRTPIGGTSANYISTAYNDKPSL